MPRLRALPPLASSLPPLVPSAAKQTDAELGTAAHRNWARQVKERAGYRCQDPKHDRATPRSFTIEENEIDIDGSEVFKGCRIGQMQLQLQPNGMATVTFTVVGQDMDVMTGAQAPYFTSPVATTSIGMTAVEALIRLGSPINTARTIDRGEYLVFIPRTLDLVA